MGEFAAKTGGEAGPELCGALLAGGGRNMLTVSGHWISPRRRGED